MPTVTRTQAVLLTGLISCVLISCERHEISATFYVVDGYRFTREERALIRSIADSTMREVRRVLPGVPPELILRVNPGSKVIPETGENGTTAPPNVVYWTVDPHRPGGVAAVADAWLRGSLFHEIHHLVRGNASVPQVSLMDAVVDEGLATAFERDFAKVPVPWGDYPENVSAWLAELMALPQDAPHDRWFSRHPDGRRWIGYKVGTYLADRATRASGRSSAELVSEPAIEIVRMALAAR